jgi:hypothetical protein
VLAYFVGVGQLTRRAPQAPSLVAWIQLFIELTREILQKSLDELFAVWVVLDHFAKQLAKLRCAHIGICHGYFRRYALRMTA